MYHVPMLKIMTARSYKLRILFYFILFILFYHFYEDGRNKSGPWVLKLEVDVASPLWSEKPLSVVVAFIIETITVTRTIRTEKL